MSNTIAGSCPGNPVTIISTTKRTIQKINLVIIGHINTIVLESLFQIVHNLDNNLISMIIVSMMVKRMKMRIKMKMQMKNEKEEIC